MKKTLRIMIAFAVATMLVGGGFAGTVSATAEDENEIEQETTQIASQSISDDDVLDANVNAGNPTTATAVNVANVGSGDQTAMAEADSTNNAGDDFDQDADQDSEQNALLDD